MMKMNNKIFALIIIIIILLLAFFITYATCAFIEWEYNPAIWPKDTRTFAPIFCLILFGIGFAINKGIE